MWNVGPFRFVASIFLPLLLLSFAAAQEPAEPEVKPAEERPAVDRERSIYIPYTKLRSLFEKEGRGVFIPYEQFQELVKAAKKASEKLPEIKPPVGALITEIHSEATVARDVVLVKSELSIEVLAEGWVRIPLRLADAAVRSAKVGDQAARLVADDQGYYLLHEKKGKNAETITLSLEYSKAFSKSPGKNQVSFQAPRAAVNEWTIRVPEAGVKVNVRPQVSTDAEIGKPEANAKETVVAAHVGAAPEVSIDWNPKAEGAAGLSALVAVQTQQEVTIEEGVVRSRVELTYDVTRAEATELKLEVPVDFKVVNLFDPNVQKWEVGKPMGDVAPITVQFFQPVRGTQKLLLELERVATDLAKEGVKIPAVKAVGADRQFGVVAVNVAPSLRAETAKREGLSQLDAAELPPGLAGKPWTFAYRFSSLPYLLDISLEAVQPRLEATEFIEAYLEPRQLAVDLYSVITIERAGVFSVDVETPEGFEVRGVSGRAVGDAVAAAVESHHLVAEPKPHLTVNFSRKALGKIGLVVHFVKRLEEPKLLTPSGETAAISFALPRLAHPALERSQGHVVLYAPEALRVNPAKFDGLRNVAPNEALQSGLSTRNGRYAGLRETVAYAFYKEPAALTLDVERRRPQVTVRQSLAVRMESGVVKYSALFHYDVAYSGVKSLRIDVPTPLVGEIRNRNAAVADRPIDPQPANVPAGYTALELKGEGEFLGAVDVPFTWEHKIGEPPVGKPVKIDVPRLIPATDERTGAKVDRAWGQIAVARAETIDVAVEGEPKGLRPIDPQLDLAYGGDQPNIARAFEFHDDWTLSLSAVRYEMEDVKRTSIDRGLVRVVATRGGQLSVQAVYRVRTSRQGLGFQLPDGIDPSAAFDAQPIHINGKPVPGQQSSGSVYVPLTNRRPDEPLLLEIRYTLPGTAARIGLPEFTDGRQATDTGPAEEQPAVQKIYMAVYLPRERLVAGVRGPWTEESPWRPPPLLELLGVVPELSSSPTNVPALLQWVTEGVPMEGVGTPGERFSEDGAPVIFSSLRPTPGDAGSLRLSVWSRVILNAMTFIVVVGLGIALLRESWSRRLAGLGLLAAAILLLAVFQPTFTGAILRGPLILGSVLAVLLWIVVSLGVGIARLSRHWMRPSDTTPATPPTETPVPPTPEGGQAYDAV